MYPTRTASWAFAVLLSTWGSPDALHAQELTEATSRSGATTSSPEGHERGWSHGALETIDAEASMRPVKN